MDQVVVAEQMTMTPAERRKAEAKLLEADSVMEQVEGMRQNADLKGMQMAELVAEISENKYWQVCATSESQYAKERFKGSESMYWALRKAGLVVRLYPDSWKQLGISKWRYLASYHDLKGEIPEHIQSAAVMMDRDEFVRFMRDQMGRARLADKSQDMLMTLRVFSSARPIVEQAMQIAKLEAGSENPSNALVNIAADYLAGHAADGTHYSGGRMNIKIAADAIRRLKHMDNLTEEVIEECVGEVSAAIASLRE